MRSQIENSYEAESKYHYDDLFVYCYLLLFYYWGYIICCHKAKESSLPGKMKIYSRYSNISITHILKGAACLHLSPMLCEGELWDLTKKVYLFLCTHNLEVVAECISKNSLSHKKKNEHHRTQISSGIWVTRAVSLPRGVLKWTMEKVHAKRLELLSYCCAWVLYAEDYQTGINILRCHAT